jgi:hypothetical protein
MESIRATWLYPLILIAGALQACRCRTHGGWYRAHFVILIRGGIVYRNRIRPSMADATWM